MGMFTKKLADWNLIDCIKMTIGMTIGTIGVLWAADKIYDVYQSRQKVNDNHNDFGNDDIYVQEEETSE